MFAVTTFPPWGWDVYARRCIGTWVEKWPGSVLAYYEGSAPPHMAGVEFRSLDDIEERTEFLGKTITAPSSFLYDVKRFCHKVYAQLDAMEELDQFWWLDADVEIREPPPEKLLNDILDESYVAFLGRNSYTETGVIGFNHPPLEFEGRYRECYDGGLIFSLRYWTDCHAFDYARNGQGFNMTPYGQGFENVLPQSPLGPYLAHHKGNLKLKLEQQ